MADAVREAFDDSGTATCKQIRLSWQKILKKTIRIDLILIGLLILVFVVYIVIGPAISQTPLAGFALDLNVLLFAILALILVIGGANILYQYLYYRTYYYDLKSDVVVIRKGIYLKVEISIPFDRIQDVYVDRDFLDAVFGLYDVHLSAATAQSGREAHIDGVSQHNASLLREMLIKKIEESKQVSVKNAP